MKFKAPFRVTVGYACKRTDSHVRVKWNFEALQGREHAYWVNKQNPWRDRWAWQNTVWYGLQERKP